MTANWIADSNTWNLPVPPAWFLQRLWDFDAQLVLVPSRQKVKGESPAYLLCRRRLNSAGLGDVAMLDNKHPDTNMCYMHHMVPIAPLRFKKGLGTTFTTQGCEALLTELKARDTWALSGGPNGDPDAVWKEVEYQEQLQERRDRANLRDRFYHMARDAYRSLKARTGQRNKTAFDANRHASKGGAPQGQRKIIVST